MIYTDLTKKAMKLCYKLHHNQVDKGGIPYVFHCFHVAEQMETEEQVCLALLHDVIEDTDYTLEDIKNAGFPDDIIEALDCITRRECEDYMDYIKRVKANSLARKVKLADLKHNSDLTRVDIVDEKAKKRIKRYTDAKRYLEE